jgi:hypothetical protein
MVSARISVTSNQVWEYRNNEGGQLYTQDNNAGIIGVAYHTTGCQGLSAWIIAFDD